jgi:TPR repeat protein
VAISVQKFAQAAEKGEAAAQYRLGLMYSTGKGVPLDYVAAHKWLNLAALRGERQARELRAELAHDMSPQQIAEAQRQAREWLQTH